MSLAYQDPVTLGDNFAAFKKKTKSKKDGVGWLIAMDVTDFKLINSTCGVKKGDEVLRVIWEILKPKREKMNWQRMSMPTGLYCSGWMKIRKTSNKDWNM